MIIKISSARMARKFILSCIFFGFIMALIVIVSCTSQTPIHTSNEDFWEGSDGLVFSFIDQNSPETVYEDTPFTIALKVQNIGAHTLSGFMTLSIEDDYMCLIDNSNECYTFSGVDAQTLSNPYKTKWLRWKVNLFSTMKEDLMFFLTRQKQNQQEH